MEVLYSRCAGLDVHKESVVACILSSGPGSQPKKEIRQFGTTTEELRGLRDWLRAEQVEQAAMESTGVYWKPVLNVLEGSCPVMVVNARHIKQVPGRKTDKADCAWIASLLRHGLLQASFVPELEVRQLRDLCRMRTTLVRDRVQVGNRLRKVLEDANIKLDSVASDALGVSGRAMIEALAKGVKDPVALAELAQGRLRKKRPELEKALEGQVTPHHRFLLGEWLRQLAFLDEQVERLEKQIEVLMEPFEWAAELLETMPGVKRTAACGLIAEIGADMSRFPSARHLGSWSGLCPGNNESAGKQHSGKSHRGNRWIKGLMTEIAWAASRTKNTYSSAQYRRLVGHRGKKRTLVAVANSLLQAAWHMLKKRSPYMDLGVDYLDNLHKQQVERSLIRRLEKLGNKVVLSPV